MIRDREQGHSVLLSHYTDLNCVHPLCGLSEEMLNLIISLNGLALEDNFVEVVLLELVNLDPLTQKALMKESLVLSEVSLREPNAIQLPNIAHIVDREALFELIRELLDVLFVADWEDHARDVVILARCQFLTDTTDADDLSESGDFTSHCEVGRCRSIDRTGDKRCE